MSEPVIKFLKKGLIKITTSIDAGTPETFKEVRGRPKFFNVFENLQKYASIDSSKVTIKYIFTEENKDERELELFIKNCLKYNLDKCNYQISINYKKEKFDYEFLKSIAFLFTKLQKNNIKKVFLDDHIMLRFGSLDKKEIENFNLYLKNQDLLDIVLDPNEVKNLRKLIFSKILKTLIL